MSEVVHSLGVTVAHSRSQQFISFSTTWLYLRFFICRRTQGIFSKIRRNKRSHGYERPQHEAIEVSVFRLTDQLCLHANQTMKASLTKPPIIPVSVSAFDIKLPSLLCHSIFNSLIDWYTLVKILFAK